MDCLINFVEDRVIVTDDGLFKCESAREAHYIVSKIHKNISNIFVVTGPGSYTGLRKSVAIAKAMAFDRDIKIYGIDILKDFLVLFGKPCAFIISEKKSWYYNESIELINRDSITCSISNMTIDCSSENIWNYRKQMDLSIFQQQYNDKYFWI